MTVTELIAYLEKLPKDTVIGVVFRAYSEYEILEESDLEFFSADEQVESKQTLWCRKARYVLRHGKIMQYDEKTWDPAETPNFVPVLAFPGN